MRSTVDGAKTGKLLTSRIFNSSPGCNASQNPPLELTVPESFGQALPFGGR